MNIYLGLLKLGFILVTLLLMQSHVFAYQETTHMGMATLGQEPNNTLDYLNRLSQNPESEITTDDLTIFFDGLRQAVEDEDIFPRPGNHFFDPIANDGFPFFDTAPDWAESTNNEFSVGAGRAHLLTALTNIDPIVRRQGWIDTYVVVGHLQHLVQDMAQPQHVRDDYHIEGTSGESRYEKYIALHNPSSFQPGDYMVPKLDSFRAFFASGDGKGLAEFVNANFVSEDTLFSGYSSPSIAGTFTTYEIGNYGFDKIGKIEYVGISYTDPLSDTVEVNPYLATASYWSRKFGIRRYTLTNKNFAEHYKRLRPRAINYSKGISNYFFRNALRVRIDNTFSTSGSSSKITLNNTSSSTLNGVVTIYVDDASGNRLPVNGATWSVNIQAGLSSVFNLPFTFNVGYYTAVFSGVHGNEVPDVENPGAVMGAYIDCNANSVLICS